ncbi:cytidylyltransferase family-domain-containing protein [Cantharellus anzutake]|uniref:cytidylyltransferase family-domain-containing protein n=1 Tax=Cantharellus anzutake TaxID=1750568 RepID=UPI0019032B36|nr:cytidylyltransferase family-domain-containing protein [Cantharellus anzutake]KAF8342307.1 cytidylyltransferase family-domain-containing protein [Cantharellus anzutake]
MSLSSSRKQETSTGIIEAGSAYDHCSAECGIYAIAMNSAKFSFSALPIEGESDSSGTEAGDEVQALRRSPRQSAVPGKPKQAKQKTPKESKVVPTNLNTPTAPTVNVKESKSATTSLEDALSTKRSTTLASQGPTSLTVSPADVSSPSEPTGPTTILKSSARDHSRSRSPAPKVTRFEPDLPSLPTPPSTAMERKRKASSDIVVQPLSKEVKLSEEKNVVPVSNAKEKPVGTDVAAVEFAKKKQNAITRTIWTLVMISGFMSLLVLGQPYIICLVFVCQALVYREVTALFSLTHPSPRGDDEERTNAWDSALNWYFFAITNYFLYGESIIYYFKHVIFSDAQFLPFATNHRFISFMLYTAGFVAFVSQLKRGYLKHQFGLFAWVHMTLLVIVVSSHFIVNNILEGVIWLWVPSSLVICNDIFAYICGIMFGRTPLIRLSPKKTVEGFVGAFLCTLVFAYIWATLFMGYPYMICPVRDLGTHAWSHVECIPNPVFIWREYHLWPPLNALLTSFLRPDRPFPPIPYAPFQLHALAMATFASLVAPFGGFFASGFKRAFDIKDFGDSIPGHGGITDRMDCQFLMGMFSYVYYSALIRQHHVTVGSVLQTIVSNLAVEEQVELFSQLKHYLDGIGAHP